MKKISFKKKQRGLIVTLAFYKNDETVPRYVTVTINGKKGDEIDLSNLQASITKSIIESENNLGYTKDDKLEAHIVCITPAVIKL